VETGGKWLFSSMLGKRKQRGANDLSSPRPDKHGWKKEVKKLRGESNDARGS